MATKLSDLTLNRGGLAMGEQSQTVTKYNNPTMRTAPTQRTAASNPSGIDQSANARVSRALAIRQGTDGGQGLAYDTSNQTTRGAAESVANPAIAESLRLSLAKQQQLAQTPYGTQSLGDRRARARAIQANQANVTAGLGAVGQMRNSQVTTEGNRISADADVLTRRLTEAGGTERTAMTEAGANSRSLLESETSRFNAGLLNDSNVEVARIQGQNQIDLRRTQTPEQAAASEAQRDMLQRLGRSGDDAALTRGLTEVANQNANPLDPIDLSTPRTTTTVQDRNGNQMEVDSAFGLASNAAELMKGRNQTYNLGADVDAEVRRLIANGALTTPQQVDAYVAQKRSELSIAAAAKAEEERAQALRDREEAQAAAVRARAIVPTPSSRLGILRGGNDGASGGLGN